MFRPSKAVLEALGFKSNANGNSFQERRNSTPLTVTYLEKRWQQMAIQGNLPGIVALLEQDPNLVSLQTALHWAAKKGRKDVAEILLNTGMEVNTKSVRGYTALHLAVIHNHENIIISLLDCGADVEARDYSGRKPKHYIKESMSLWLQRKLGKKMAPSVLVSSEETLNGGFHNIGSIFFDIKALSNSLGSGLDKLDEKPNKLHIPRNKVARSSSFVKIYKNVTGKFKDKNPPKLEIPECTSYQRTGRARSAPDINNIATWNPRFVKVMR
ncbi:ankyrin repeat domain-containing protein SOWAHC-like [Porites lutea]|uniref:ankyrin repeat domain-containing protein SOWAHC-like n=1 Tax=Porites lutea TaxID=51062 RepID=UPI003CC6D54C